MLVFAVTLLMSGVHTLSDHSQREFLAAVDVVNDVAQLISADTDTVDDEAVSQSSTLIIASTGNKQPRVLVVCFIPQCHLNGSIRAPPFTS